MPHKILQVVEDSRDDEQTQPAYGGSNVVNSHSVREPNSPRVGRVRYSRNYTEYFQRRISMTNSKYMRQF